MVGRFVVGIGVAVSGIADVSYLHECAPIEWRGSIVSVNEACISLGFLLAYIVGYVYADYEVSQTPSLLNKCRKCKVGDMVIIHIFDKRGPPKSLLKIIKS